MSRSEPELWALLKQAGGQMDFGEAQQALMEDVIRHADAGGFPKLAFVARRRLANAYSVDRQWQKAFPLFARCLSDYDQRSWQFGPEEERSLRHWYTDIVQSMAEFPDISLAQIYGACDDMEQRFKAGGHSLREVHAARRWIAQLAGDWDEEERCYHRWIAAGGPDPRSVWDFEEEVERLVLRGDDASVARARELATPVLAGEVGFDQPSAPIECLMLLPLAKAGAHADAATAYGRSDRAMSHGVYRYEFCSMQIEFCALTGNEDEGLVVLQSRMIGYPTLNRPSGKMEFATAGAVLLRRLVEEGRGAELVGDNSGTYPKVPAAALQDEMTRTALDLAARFDARNGTTGQGDRIRARLAARPVVDHLPLTSTSRKRTRTAVTDGLSPEQVLDRGEWHQRCIEDDVAREYLSAVADPPPPHLAARVVELRALLDWGPAGGDALRWAAEAHRLAGDNRRYLLCKCWLGRWLAENERFKDGKAVVAKAVRELHKSGDTWAIAWGELCNAQVLAARGVPGYYEALQRAGRAAAVSGDPLALGVVAGLESMWRAEDRTDLGAVLRLATAAKDALIAAGATALALTVLVRLRTAHEIAGTGAAFAAMVEHTLAVPPPGIAPLVLAHLRYERGRARLLAGYAAEAIDDLNEGVAQAATRVLDTAEQWFYLAAACHTEKRFMEAMEAARIGAAWLNNMRRRGALDDPHMADRCRLILADSHFQIGELDDALENYTRHIDETREFGNWSMLAVALTKAGELLSGFDRDAESADRFREGADLFSQLGDEPMSIRVRCSESTLWMYAGDAHAALAAFGRAEQAAATVSNPQEHAALQDHVTKTGTRLRSALERAG